MKQILSQDNKIFKACSQLKQKKNRDKVGKYLIEGPNLVADALRSGAVIELLLVSERSMEHEEIKQLCREYARLDKKNEGSVYVLDEKLFKKLTETETPQGIFGVVAKTKISEEEFFRGNFRDKFDDSPRTKGNIIVLDRLQDPGNVGTIIRTAEAAGYDGIMILKGTVDLYSPKVVRSCTGSLFRMPVFFVDQPDEAISMLRKHGKKVVSTGLKDSKYYHEVELKKDVAIVIGNEGNGICEEFMHNSDVVVKIPMVGQIESLNASVAAAILMYEAVK